MAYAGERGEGGGVPCEFYEFLMSMPWGGRVGGCEGRVWDGVGGWGWGEGRTAEERGRSWQCDFFAFTHISHALGWPGVRERGGDGGRARSQTDFDRIDHNAS